MAKNKIIQPKYSVQPTTRDQLRQYCTAYRGRLQEIDTSLITDMSFLFSYSEFSSWTNDDWNGIGTWNTSKVTNISYMFENRNTFNQDISNWDVSKVEQLEYIFSGCTSFNQPLGTWNTSKVTDMSAVFKGCSSFNQELENWDLSSCVGTLDMFNGATSFNQDLSSWNVINIAAQGIFFYYNMFKNCPIEQKNKPRFSAKYRPKSKSELITLLRTPGVTLVQIDTTEITDMSDLFNGNSETSSYFTDVNTWNVKKVTNFSRMFKDCTNFNALLDWWRTYSLEEMEGMFEGLSNYNKPLNNFDTSKVTNMNRTFRNCSLYNQPLNNWDTSKVTYMNYMFQNATTFDQDISNWNVDNVSTYTDIFDNCPIINDHKPIKFRFKYKPQTKEELIQIIQQPGINLGEIDTSLITDMSYLFESVNNKSNSEFSGIEKWIVSNVTNMEGMFKNCVNFNQDINNWDVSNVTNMVSMFEGCTDFNQPLNNWNVSKITSLRRIFKNCYAFDRDINNWNVSNVTDAFEAFYNARNYNKPLNAWTVNNITNINYMFFNASSFNQDISSWTFNNITQLISVFSGCISFNKPLNNWNVSNVTTTEKLFNDCTSFNQPLNNWTLNSLTNSTSMFQNATSFNQDIDNWNFNKTQVISRTDMFNNCPTQPVWYPDISETINQNIQETINISKYYPGATLSRYNMISLDNNLNINKQSDGIFNVVYNGTNTTAQAEVKTINGRNEFAFNINLIDLDRTFDIKLFQEKTVDFSIEYQGISLTSLNITSNDVNLIVKNKGSGIFSFTPMSFKTMTATVTLSGITGTITINTTRLLENYSKNIYQETPVKIDFFGILNIPNYTSVRFTTVDQNLLIREITPGVFNVICKTEGDHIANVELAGDTSTYTFNTSKLINDKVINSKTNIDYTLDFTNEYPDSIFTDLNLVSQSTDVTVTKLDDGIFNLYTEKVGRFNLNAELNGSNSTITYATTNLISDETFEVKNNYYDINFKSKYPNANLTGLKLVSNNQNVLIEKKSELYYRLVFLNKGTYDINVVLGNNVSIYKFRVFFIDTSSIEIYQYPDSFIRDLIKPELYDDSIVIYQYNQYGEIEWINKYFDYMNTKMKKYLDYIYLWFVLKTNQDLSKLNINFLTDKNTELYLNFLKRYYEGIYKSFGTSSTSIFWDGIYKWNEDDVKWDATANISNLNINKFKSMLRFIQDISCKSFTIMRFIQFCNEFANADVEESNKVELFVDETSFTDPSTVIVYSTKLNENTDILDSIIRSAYKNIMPINDFLIRQKTLP